MGGRQTKGLRDVLQGDSIGSAVIRVGDVGADPPRGTSPGKLSEHVCQADNGEVDKATGGGGWEYPPLEAAM